MRIGRRALLVYGVSGLASGCVYFRWGAGHELVASKGASVEDGVLRIPMEELKPLEGGEALLVKASDAHPELLVAKAEGEFIVVTAECGHWGCTVDWTPAVKEWTCPCHGSRFNAQGEILEGPADEGLKSLKWEVVAGSLHVKLG